MHPAKLIVTGLAALVVGACDNADNLNVVVGEMASDRIELIAEVNEPILEILVAEGEAVTTGQLILRQDDTRASARVREAEAAVGQARARLDELVRGPRQEQIAQARANLAGARRDIEFRRTQLSARKTCSKKSSPLRRREIAQKPSSTQPRRICNCAGRNSRNCWPAPPSRNSPRRRTPWARRKLGATACPWTSNATG